MLFLIPIETKVRGLDPRLFLGLTYLQRNPNAAFVIGPKHAIKSYIKRTKVPFTFVAKGMDPTKIEWYKELRSRQGHILYLDEEGGPSKPNPEHFRVRYVAQAIQYADVVCVWGPQQMDFIRSLEGNETLSNLIVTGHPRFDLRKRVFGEAYQYLSEVSNKERDRIVLINCNFGLSNSHFSKEQYRNHIKPIMDQRTEEGFDEEDFNEQWDYQELVFPKFVEAVAALAKTYPKQKFVVRPHPAERREYYEEKFVGVKNVDVKSTGSVQEYIVDADVVIHHDCTTAIEAFFYGVPTISYHPVEWRQDFLDKNLNAVPMGVSFQVHSYEDLEMAVGKVLSGDHEDIRVENAKEIAARVFNNVDYMAAERIIEEFVKRVPVSGSTTALTPSRAFSSRSIKSSLGVLAAKVKASVGLYDRVKKARIESKFPGLALHEVQDRCRVFSQAMGWSTKFSVEQLEGDTFFVSLDEDGSVSNDRSQ